MLFLINSGRFGREVDHFRLDELSQARMDSIKTSAKADQLKRIRPFNPNYISDYKGYVLGMTTKEIDRLFEFRHSGRFVNSSKEFQRVTGISDSLLTAISPYFKFPKWATNPISRSRKSTYVAQPEVTEVGDLNKVGREELREIKGIGEVLSGRIIRFREALGGFLIEEQLYDVYGLDREVADRVIASYVIMDKPAINPLNVNLASEKDLARIVYISAPLARRIVEYRSKNGNFKSWNELTKIEDFPLHQIDRIKLYLTL